MLYTTFLANQLVDYLTVRMPPFYTQSFHTKIADSGIISVPSRGDNQCSDTFCSELCKVRLIYIVTYYQVYVDSKQ